MRIYKPYVVVKFRPPSFNGFWDMNFYPVKSWQTDGQTDGKQRIRPHRAICTGGLNKIDITLCCIKTILSIFTQQWHWKGTTEVTAVIFVVVKCKQKRMARLSCTTLSYYWPLKEFVCSFILWILCQICPHNGIRLSRRYGCIWTNPCSTRTINACRWIRKLHYFDE